MSGFKDFLVRFFPAPYDTGGEVMSALLGAIGAAMDAYDPIATTLAAQFSISTASGDALNILGLDWDTPRRAGEDDDDYRKRLLSQLPIFLLCPAVSGVQAALSPFTGVEPIIYEYCENAFIMSETEVGAGAFTGSQLFQDGALASEADEFTFEAHIQNPDNEPYNHADAEQTVKRAKPSRSTGIIFHNGIDTSGRSYKYYDGGSSEDMYAGKIADDGGSGVLGSDTVDGGAAEDVARDAISMEVVTI